MNKVQIKVMSFFLIIFVFSISALLNAKTLLETDESFELVKYTSGSMALEAYLATPKGVEVNKQYPAVIWLSKRKVDLGVLEQYSYYNDQSAKRYWRNGVFTLYPINHDKVSDLNTSIEYLLKHKQIDPEKIFVIGHDIGAVQAIELSSQNTHLKSVFALGPDFKPGVKYEKYFKKIIKSIKNTKSPLYIMEGELSNSKVFEHLTQLEWDNVELIEISRAGHYDYVAFMNNLISNKISLMESDLEVSEYEISNVFSDHITTLGWYLATKSKKNEMLTAESVVYLSVKLFADDESNIVSALPLLKALGAAFISDVTLNNHGEYNITLKFYKTNSELEDELSFLIMDLMLINYKENVNFHTIELLQD